uniref:Uncharacterized protein n=1 Tax=Arion vulgaris TaxID=1028688 RepID=A0A0B7AH24_9EUPU
MMGYPRSGFSFFLLMVVNPNKNRVKTKCAGIQVCRHKTGTTSSHSKAQITYRPQRLV